NRSLRPGTDTKMVAGLLAKLNELVMTYPSGATTRPVVGPRPLRTPPPIAPPPGSAPTTSAPPDVSIRTTDGATRATAALIAASALSLTSWPRVGAASRNSATIATGRIDFLFVGWAESSRPTIGVTVGLEDSAHPTRT